MSSLVGDPAPLLIPAPTAAKAIGRSVQTLRRWAARGWIVPTSRDPLTGTPLYRPDQIHAMYLVVGAVRTQRILRLRRRRAAAEANTS